jgi:hypothetical protein
MKDEQRNGLSDIGLIATVTKMVVKTIKGNLLSEILAMAFRLPPTFTSLYRLVLRATSASVLHHTSATRGLRQLWRPTFQEASKVIRQLNDEFCEKAEREKSLEWLRVWERQSLYLVSLDQ